MAYDHGALFIPTGHLYLGNLGPAVEGLYQPRQFWQRIENFTAQDVTFIQICNKTAIAFAKTDQNPVFCSNITNR